MNLQQFFNENQKIAIAFSGGVDSAYLLYAAKKYAKDVKAYYVNSQFQPQFELDDAVRLAKQLRVDMEIIQLDVLKDEKITSNPSNRCYFCKRRIFVNIMKNAIGDGYETLLDGTNASDDIDDRPGMLVLKELKVLSPLRICGMTKDEIRKLSREAGLFTWDKPSYACLATRIPAGEIITEKKLARTEKWEGYLASLGFRDFRIRSINNMAKIQVTRKDMDKLFEMEEELVSKLSLDYDGVCLDREARDE